MTGKKKLNCNVTLTSQIQVRKTKIFVAVERQSLTWNLSRSKDMVN